MNFNSLNYLLFLLTVFVVFYSIPRGFRIWFLVCASVTFYAMSGLVHAGLMLSAICWSYFAATAFPERRPVNYLTALLPPMAVLFVVKYLSFTLDAFGAPAEMRDVLHMISEFALPAGISFYTFHIASYNIDVLDGKIAADRRPRNIFAFVSFFPLLIAGPIVRYAQLVPQFAFVEKVRASQIDVRLALKCISYGLFCKTFFSDILLSMHEKYVLQNGNQAADFAFSILAYSFVMYYDFWSYSIIAIGSAALFGVKLPLNFLEPYKSPTPKDFWRRWHVSLSTWIRDYVYFALGGNRKWIRNIILIFLVCGVWHGAGWNFIVWGAYHAALVLSYSALQPVWQRLPHVLQVALTFCLVSLGWPLFQYDLGRYADYMLSPFSGIAQTGGAIFGVLQWLFLGAVAVWTFVATENTWLWDTKSRSLVNSPYVMAVALFLAIMFFSYSRTFIYFRF